MTKLLVATGKNHRFESVELVEVINLDKSNPNITCQNLPNYPLQVYGATGQLYQGSPIICGGESDDDGVKQHCECYSLEHGDWKRIPDLSACRHYLESTILSIPGQAKDSLVIAGGSSGSQSLDIVEVFNGAVWNTDLIPNLPSPIGSHCMVKLNNSMLMSIAGYDTVHVANTNFFDANQNVWFFGPELKQKRAGHVCGVVNVVNPLNGQAEKVVVVAGGYDGTTYLTSVELLFLNNPSQGWVEGPSLPLKITSSTMVEYNNGLVLIGGYGYGPDFGGSKLYQLSSVFGQWEVMEQTLKDTRFTHVAFLVPDELVVCN